MRRPLATQAFLAIVAVSLGAIATAGFVVRASFTRAFTEWMGMPHPRMMVPGAGRGMAMDAADRAFQTAVDRGILLGVVVSIVFAALAAWLIARWLGRPLSKLTAAARAIAAGDLEHRVETSGPSEVEDLGVAFNEMADSLGESEALRRRLVADVAHEIRNPVASLRAQAEGMADGVLPLDPERLRSIVGELGDLSRLVDDLQELSVAEAGQLPYEMGEVDVAELVWREVERAALSAPEGLAVASGCGASGAVVLGDERRLSQVLRNLLSNAVRHTRAGSVRVRCDVEGEVVRISVTDTGEGIPETDLPYIFERFYRADSARARHTGGAGIGLAIARRIVEDHGGAVFAESVEGSGATVGFTLPLAPREG